METVAVRTVWFLGCILVPLLNACGEDKSPAEADTMRLQGDWIVVGMEGGGHKATADELKGMKWSIKGNVITATQPGLTGQMRFHLSGSGAPKQIDITSLSGSVKGQIDPGIYELKSGRLRICYRDPDQAGRGRPKSFEDARKDGYGMIILKRK